MTPPDLRNSDLYLNSVRAAVDTSLGLVRESSSKHVSLTGERPTDTYVGEQSTDTSKTGKLTFYPTPHDSYRHIPGIRPSLVCRAKPRIQGGYIFFHGPYSTTL